MDVVNGENAATHGMVALVTALGAWLLHLYVKRHQQTQESRRDTIDEWRTLFEQRGADLARLQALCGQLTDRLTAEQVKNGKLAAENKYLRERLAECGGQCDGPDSGG